MPRIGLARPEPAEAGLAGRESRVHQAAAYGLACVTAALDATGPWEAVALPSGAADFVAFLERPVALDAAVILASRDVTLGDDPDGLGRLLARLREVLPRPAPVMLVASAEVHPSAVTMAAIDGLFTPFGAVDQGLGRAAERAALALRLSLAGVIRPCVHAVRLPLLWPRTSAASAKWAAVVSETATAACGATPDLLTVGLLGGAPQSAPPLAGVTLAITTREPMAKASDLVSRLAVRIWEHRAAAAVPPMSLAQAISLARAEHAIPLVLVDAGDRIDQGGIGDGVELLAAIAWNGVTGVLSTGHIDPDLVAAAMRAGVGASLTAVFRGAQSGGPFETDAEVVAASPPSGGTVVLRFGTVTTIVSNWIATALDVDFADLGVQPSDYTTFLVKSGPEASHALGELCAADWQDVDTPGPTTHQPHPDWALRNDAPYPLAPERQWSQEL